MRHHQRAFGTVGPEPDERKRFAAVLSDQEAKHDAHQRVDARVERPSREGDAFPAVEANLLQVPATAHRQRRTKEVVHLPRNRAGGGPRQEVVPVLVITLLPQIADDLSEVERQSQAIGVNPDILEGVVQLSPWFHRRRALRQPAVAHRVAKCEVASVRGQVAIGLQRHERRRKSEVIAERMIRQHRQPAQSHRDDSSATLQRLVGSLEQPDDAQTCQAVVAGTLVLPDAIAEAGQLQPQRFGGIHFRRPHIA